MSTIRERYELARQEMVAAEGWFTVHQNWIVACALCFVVGTFLGWRYL